MSNSKKKGNHKRKRGNMSSSPKMGEPKKVKMNENSETPRRQDVNTPVKNIFSLNSDIVGQEVSVSSQSKNDKTEWENKSHKKTTNAICHTCKELIECSKNLDIVCKGCIKKFHAYCVNLNEKQLECYKEIKDKVDWRCNDCTETIGAILEENNSLKVKIIRLEDELMKIKKVLVEKHLINGEEATGDNIVRRNADEIDAIEKIKEDMIRELGDKIEQKIKKGFIEYQKEMVKVQNEDQNTNSMTSKTQDRDCNLIIYNVEESEYENTEDRKRYDYNVAIDIIENGVKESGFVIQNVIRLGKKEDEKGNKRTRRPILLKLSSKEEKWRILKKAKNLRYAPRGMHKVILSLDLEEEDRKKRKKLYEELKSKRESGDDSWVIFRGELIKKNF